MVTTPPRVSLSFYPLIPSGIHLGKRDGHMDDPHFFPGAQVFTRCLGEEIGTCKNSFEKNRNNRERVLEDCESQRRKDEDLPKDEHLPKDFRKFCHPAKPL